MGRQDQHPPNRCNIVRRPSVAQNGPADLSGGVGLYWVLKAVLESSLTKGARLPHVLLNN